jgi:hypothetical protein
MKQKRKKDKKNRQSEPEIREGSANYSIDKPTANSPEESYPRLSKSDQQYKNQSEFIDDQPNRKEKEQE